MYYKFRGPQKDLGNLLVQELSVDDFYCSHEMHVPLDAVQVLLYEKPLKDIKAWLTWYFTERAEKPVENESVAMLLTLKTHLMAVVQAHLNIIENAVTSDIKGDNFEKILYFVLLCKPLFHVPGLGLDNFLKKVKLKLIQTMGNGLVVSFLMFCELCPQYVTESVFPVFCRSRHHYYFYTIPEQQRRLRTNPMFRLLVEKHWEKFLRFALQDVDVALRDTQHNLT